MANIPEHLRYTRDHEWCRLEDGEAVVGLTEFAQRQLGEVVFVELPAPDERFDGGEPFGSVESVKAVSEVYMPVSGVVVEANQVLAEEPERINDDPYGDGWVLRVRADDPKTVERQLMTAAEYAVFLKEESES